MYIELSYIYTYTQSYAYNLFLQFEFTHKGVSFEACRNLELSDFQGKNSSKDLRMFLSS